MFRVNPLHNKIFLVLFLFLSGVTHAIDPYNPLTGCGGGEEIQNLLASLKIDPEIKTNGEFLGEVGRRYGNTITETLVSAHPVLREAGKSFDMKTVEWMLEKFVLADKSSVQRIFMTPFNTDKTSHGAKSLLNMMVNETWPNAASIPLFLDEKQMTAAKTLFAKNDFAMVSDLLSGSYGVNDEVALMMAKTLYNKIFEEGNYRLGFDSLGTTDRRITFVGHGSAGGDSLAMGSTKLNFSEIADGLVTGGLPKDANLEITACYGACGNLGDFSKTDLSVEQLKEAFLAQTITDHIGNKEDSFGYLFSKALYEKYPDFEGSVTAYNGLVTFFPIPAHARDPLDPTRLVIKNTFAVGLKASNYPYQTVWFDIREMSQIYTKDTFLVTSNG